MNFFSKFLIFILSFPMFAQASEAPKGVIVNQGIVCGSGETPSKASSGLMGSLYMMETTPSSNNAIYVNGTDLTGKPVTGFYQVKFPIVISGLSVIPVRDYFEACVIVTSKVL